MTDTFASRLVVFRKSLGMTQDAFCMQTGVPLSTLKRYEGSRSAPSLDSLGLMAKLGVNIHWLATGIGTMMLAGVANTEPAASSTPPKAPEAALPPAKVTTKINVDALVKAFEVMTQTARPGETPAQTARKAVDFYMYLISNGMITPDGIGEGDLSNAA